VFAVATSGNADTRTLGLGGEVVFDPGTWKRLGRVAYVETEAGLAYQVVANGAHTLEVLGGAGFTQEQRLLGDDLSLATANGTGRYEWAFSESSALTEEAAFVAALNSGDDWRFTNEIAATAALSSLLSLKLSQKLSYLNRPVVGFRKTDTIFAAALVANF
jgi:putative salt-induced outer membrane protein YdiY